VTVSTASTDPVSASSNANYDQVCLGGNVTLTVNGGALGTGASWVWYEGGCGAGTSIGSGTSLTITPAATGAHVYYVRAEGGCGNTICRSVTVNVISAPPAGTIGVTAAPTDGCVGAPSQTVSVNAVAGCTFYRWSSGQAGVRFNGNPGPYETTVPTVNITFISLPAAGSSGWSLCVFGGNACGNTNTICSWVRATLSMPSAIVGAPIGCPASSGNPYSVPVVAGAATYVWSSSTGITITGNGAPSVTLSFAAGFVSGTVSVHAQTSCGYNGPDRTMSINRAPAIPGAIIGTSYPCPAASAAFSVAAVPGAANYTWTTSVAGAVVTGTGTSCSIAFPAAIPGGSTVSVIANSSCPFSSPVRSKGVASGLPAVPANINGPATGQCGQTGVSYSITPVALATGYNWSTTCGTIAGSNNLSAVTVDWPANFNGCVLSVNATNACGTGGVRTLSVLAAPAIPPAVTGNAAPCIGGVDNYSTAGSSGATGYIWTVPAGATILGPSNGASVLVQWGSTGGNITVRASNSCGNSAIRSFACTISCRQSQLTSSAPALDAELYPNPAAEKATLKFNAAAVTDYTITMTDLVGQSVLSAVGTTTTGTNVIELNLTSIAKGVYMISIMSGNETGQIKVMVQ
jgi:hypothetical protein